MIEFVHDLKRRSRPPIAPTPAAHWPTWLGVFALAVLAYLPAALAADLLQFDDNFFFGPDNPEFRAGWRTVATEPIANAYLPVAHLSLWFDYACTLDSPRLMRLLPHLHSILLHALAAVVLVRLLLQLGVARLVAHVVGALFVVHPALCESVAWVSSRKDVLSGLFVFLALHQTVRFAHRPALWRLAGVAALGIAAMYSKPTAVVLPLLAGATAWWCGGARVRWCAPLLLLLLTVPIALQHQALAAAEGTLASGSAADRLAQVPGAFWHYLRVSVWPLDLNVLYPEVDTLARFRDQKVVGTVALALLLLLPLGALCWWRLRLGRWPQAARPIAFGLLAFVIALLPFNTAYPASSIAAADRYLYLAVPWLALAAVALAARLHANGPWFAAVLVLPLGWLCGSRAHDFRDDESLWRASLAVDEENAVAHLNLVYDRLRRSAVAADQVVPHLNAAVRAARYPIHELRARAVLRQFAMAAADYEQAARHARAAIAAAEAQLGLERAPRRVEQAEALLLRAHIEAFEPFRQHGDEAAADASLLAARKMAPDHPEVIAFGAIRQLAGLRDELLALAAAGKEPRLADDDARGAAVDEALAAARQSHPDHAGLWLAQAEWDRGRGRMLPALRAYRRAQAADSGAVDGWLGAARLLRDLAKYEDAADYARKGLRAVADPRLRQELALALVGLNRFDEAEQHLEAYLRLYPDDRDSARILANLLIGRAYVELGESGPRSDVGRLVQRALEYNPDEPKAHLVLGRVAKQERRFADAVRHFEQAVELLPTFDDARLQLANALAALGYSRFLQRDDEGATDAWLRCLEVAPADFDQGELEGQLQQAWQRLEARGVQRLADGDRRGAIADFRRCLRIDPEQHWAAWLLATALHEQADADLDELERLCRQAVRWQERHALDAGRQVYLLATTLARKGDEAGARRAAADYLEHASADVEPQVLAALRRLAAN